MANNKRQPRILVVDDTPANLVALRRLLKDIPAELIEASSGNEALIKSIESDNLALILLDVQMPEMNGFETAQFLQDEPYTSKIPIIFVTANQHDEEFVLQGYQSGAVDYIQKPINAPILLSKIRIFLELWQLRANLEDEIRERKHAESKVERLSRLDPLTQLPNRRQLFCELDGHIAQAERHGDSIAVLFIDMDRFKPVNDSLGHAVGDETLKEIAKRLELNVRPGDTTARLGGDEFVVVMTRLNHDTDLTFKIEAIQNALSEPYRIDDHVIHLGSSIGVALYPNHGKDAETLVGHADIAMYEAKHQGRDRFRFYDDRLNEIAHQRLRIEAQLLGVLGRNELALHYQPIFNVSSGKIIGAEALMRWVNPTLGVVPPDHFIPVMESTAQIHNIGRWAIKQAMAFQQVMQDRLGFPFRIALNVSPVQLRNDQLIEALEDYPHTESLEIEITEGVLLENTTETHKHLHQLLALGARLSVDDFGTGYSALSYLKRYPMHTVKIDRSFIMDIPGDEDDCVLTRAIIAMAHGLGMQVVAEGVETQAQWDMLSDLGCDYAQGFFMGKPMPEADFIQLTEQPPELVSSQGSGT